MAMQPLARAFTALEGRGRNQPGAFGLRAAQAEVRAKDHSAAPTGLGGPFRLRVRLKKLGPIIEA